MTQNLLRVASAIGCLLIVSTAGAWNDLGHMTVSQIAYRELSGEQRQAIAAILRQHPHYEIYFKPPVDLEISEAEWLFMRAGTWADFVRPPKDFDRAQIDAHPIYRFHRGPWHYINYPFRAGQPFPVSTPAALIAPDGEDTDIVRQLNLSRQILAERLSQDPGRPPELTDAQHQAVRLCWLFHLVGDIHQPLHASAMVDETLFPGPQHGDAGGNFVMIRTAERNRPLNLHAYWDGVLGYVTEWRDVRNLQRLQADLTRCRDLADQLTRPAIGGPRDAETEQNSDVATWAAESFELSYRVGYAGGNLQFASKTQVDDGAVSVMQVPVLPADQQRAAREVAQRRMALAGYRLAFQLQKLAAHNTH